MIDTHGALAITKQLSANDTGDTGGHQAGMLIPKDRRVLSFFPPLEADTKNPRHHLIFYDDDGCRWEFAFIYYNNVHFGGTRNEYRLTRMTPYLRQQGLHPGDSVTLSMNQKTGRRFITYHRLKQHQYTAGGRLRLGTAWKEVKI